MRIEIALDPEVNASQKLALNAQIPIELEHLRESCEFWSSLKWTLKMFEVVLARTGLLLTPEGVDEHGPDFGIDPFSNTDRGSVDRSNGDYDAFTGMPAQDYGDINMLDDESGFITGRNTEEWLQDLLGCGFSGN